MPYFFDVFRRIFKLTKLQDSMPYIFLMSLDDTYVISWAYILPHRNFESWAIFRSEVSEELQRRGAEGLCDPLAGTGCGSPKIWFRDKAKKHVLCYLAGGGFQTFFYVHPETGNDIFFDLRIFFDKWVGSKSPSSYSCLGLRPPWTCKLFLGIGKLEKNSCW